MRIVVDNREHERTINVMKKFFGTLCSVEQNKDGDILVFRDDNPTICIELKTVADFISSYTSRHIQDQALRMREKFDYSYIIIYGSFDDVNYKYQKFSPKQYYANIVSLQLRYKVPTFCINNLGNVPNVVQSIISNINKESEPIEPPLVKKKDVNKKIEMLLGIPYVGKKTAGILLKEFKTPQNVLNASDEELLSIKGIGSKIVNGINQMR